MTKPNIIYIYADDLGRGMLSCYGQQHFRTPYIDRLASEGVRLTQAYGTSFCAPARASLMTGMHDAHAGRWTFTKAGVYKDYHEGKLDLMDLYELIHNTGIRPRDGQRFLAHMAREAGYVTGQIGKLEWGFSTTGPELAEHGWDYHYGYYDHERCHGFYPPFLWENGDRVDIPGNTDVHCGRGHYSVFPDGTVPHDPEGRGVYSQDLFDEKILEFLQAHRGEPFFLYHPSQLPHGPTYYPDVYPQVADNPDLTPVEKEYASMVLRLDETVGKILAELDGLGLADSTIVIFAADNGHAPGYQQPGRFLIDTDLDGNPIDQITTKFYSDANGDVFDGNDGMAGLKCTNWEGGAKIPFVVRWPGRVAPGTVSDHLIANYDTMASIADLLDVELDPADTDGITFLPALQGHERATEHNHVVYASQDGPSLVTRDGWKLRVYLRRDRILGFAQFGAHPAAIDDAVIYQLYYLPDDYREERDLAADQPDKLHELRALLLKECDGNLANGTPQAHFAFYNYGYARGPGALIE